MAPDHRIYRQIVESSLDGLWLVDPTGRTLYANPRVAELLGRTEAEVAAMRVPDALDDEGRAQFEAHLDELARNGPHDQDIECIYRRPDGSPVPLVVSERALYDEEHRLVGYVHRLAEDGRRTLLDELTRSQSQLAEAQAIARIGSWEIQVEPRQVTWSEQMYDLLDVDPETFVPGPEEFIGQIIEADRLLVADEWSRLAVEPGERSIDARLRLRDGSTRWVRTLGRVLEAAPDGTPVRYGGTVQDINDLKQTELQLLDAVELNTLMQFIATAANETSSLDEALARIKDLLLAHPDWKGGSAYDVTDAGLVFRHVGPETGAETEPSPLERAVAERVLAESGVVFEEEADPESPLIGFPVLLDGEPIVVLVVINRSPFERHALMRSLVAQVADQLSQVAEREKVGAELAAARDLAMAGSHAKSEFLATMSHEIRTPLNGVIGLNDLLLRGNLDPDQRQLAEAMQGAARTLLVLISDILDFSKIEAGGLELEAVAFQPTVVVQGTLELFAPVARAKGIDLRLDLDGVPDRLEGDPSRFGQVLSNLVSNAVKFTHQGGVQVRVAARTVDGVSTLTVEVRDTGIGMDDEQLSRIFQPFRQADASTTRNFGGTGLGLAIAHRLATALGGEIEVESTLGQGSTFRFTGQFRVPVPSQRPVARVAPGIAGGGPGGHVLVVEDNDVNQLVAVGMLEVLGYTCEVAVDGAAAAARAAGGRFDAVLMDLQMPRLDGFAATRLIRQAEPPGVRVPIIALTASATAGEEERCLAAGMTGFLSKPVAVERLGRVLGEQLGHRPGSNPVVGAPADAQPESPAVTPTLDTARLEELAEMGAAAVPLIQRAIDNFVASSSDHLDALGAALAAGDATNLRSAAHRLKGSAANLGASRVAELALSLELLAEDGLDASGRPHAVSVLLEELSAELDQALVVLADYRLEASSEDARTA